MNYLSSYLPGALTVRDREIIFHLDYELATTQLLLNS